MTYEEAVAALEAAKARKSPSIRVHHRRQCEAAAAAEAERERNEEYAASWERWNEVCAAKAGDPRFDLPDRPGQGWDDRIFGAGERAR